MSDDPQSRHDEAAAYAMRAVQLRGRKNVMVEVWCNHNQRVAEVSASPRGPLFVGGQPLLHAPATLRAKNARLPDEIAPILDLLTFGPDDSPWRQELVGVCEIGKTPPVIDRKQLGSALEKAKKMRTNKVRLGVSHR